MTRTHWPRSSCRSASCTLHTGYGLHGFRRGIASNLYELGADEQIVQRVLRHAKSHVTKDRYFKTFDPALVAAMKKLEATVDLETRVHQECTKLTRADVLRC